MGSLGSQEFMAGWRKLGQGMSEDSVLQQIAFGLWCNWKCRNEAWFNDNRILPCIVIDLWQRQVTVFNAAMAEEDGAGDQRMRQVDAGDKFQTEGAVNGWRRPDSGSLKLNCDAAWRKESRLGGVSGRYVTVLEFQRWLEERVGIRYLSPIMAEAASIRQRLEMCIHRGFSESGEAVEVETDSKGLIQMLNKEVQLQADVSMEFGL